MSQDISIYSPENLTAKDKQIYNSFLATSRSVKNQPFKLRDNFEKLDPEKFTSLKKLSIFFAKYPHINIGDFFIAPYKIYGTTDYYDLKFYNTRKAVVCYSNYIKTKETDDPDSDDTINNCKNIFKVILKYCADQKITLEQYKNYIPQGNTMPIWLVHLKDHVINFYVLHSLNIDKETRQIEAEILNFFVKDFYNLLSKTRTKYITSTKLKTTLQNCVKLIGERLLIYGK